MCAAMFNKYIKHYISGCPLSSENRTRWTKINACYSIRHKKFTETVFCWSSRQYAEIGNNTVRWHLTIYSIYVFTRQWEISWRIGSSTVRSDSLVSKIIRGCWIGAPYLLVDKLRSIGRETVWSYQIRAHYAAGCV